MYSKAFAVFFFFSLILFQQLPILLAFKTTQGLLKVENFAIMRDSKLHNQVSF